MEYNHREIEKKWQKFWAENKTFSCHIDSTRPKYYVLDMFPYPSGAGLHVGHPLGYIASDIVSRYKRLKGFNVLHPMGYDAFGLPAEQYAIQTGTHPAITTEKNILRYREQMDKIGFSFDWEREVRTSDPNYYKWTQWTFIQLFKHWYNKKTNKAEPVDQLLSEFESSGNMNIEAACGQIEKFTAEEWRRKSEVEKQDTLMHYRLAYLADTWVNWCQELGTVLANDEVVNGVSERGGYPVERKQMRQWSLRITAYAQRLLNGLEKLEWFESLKEMQRYWIGRSEGAAVFFKIKGFDESLEVFTTRPDTLWGATFMVLAPEHELIEKITSAERYETVNEYVIWAKNRSEVERMAEVKKITGVFTGAYGINPVNGEEIPIWTADYVLAGYGTGAIMAVPAHDSRDFAFAKHFGISIRQVVSKPGESPSDPLTWDDAFDAKAGTMIQSGFITGLVVQLAIQKTIEFLEQNKLGSRQVNFKLRDAIFSRQRYWGEPFPIYYKDGMPHALDELELPLELPPVDKYLPTETGEPPLARAENWTTKEGYPLETNTMPGFAGSSGYYLRYMDPWNKESYFSKEANEYWRDVDLYLGGDEHATGHLIYSRFWNMFLFDLGLVCEEEPFKKLINQGKIQGRSSFVYRIEGTNTFVSFNLRKEHKTTPIHVEVSLVDNDELDMAGFRNWRSEFRNAEFILEDGKYICGWEVEKMSKSKHNVVNPDELIDRYGADTFRLYEMFLGPIENHKPWDTKGIEGVYRFIKKLWRLFFDEKGNKIVVNDPPSPEELKVLHLTIRKTGDDIERFSFNTAVSQFMICVNALTDLHCHKKEVLQPMVILLSSYAPHISEELWIVLGNKPGISFASFPVFNEAFVTENSFVYPVSFNGKTRFKLELPRDMTKEDVEKAIMGDERTEKWTAEKQIRKVIVIPNKIINVVVS
jgi:leucyl-tRNA synthetase